MNVLLALKLFEDDSDAPPTDALSHHEPKSTLCMYVYACLCVYVSVCVCVMYLI